MISEQIHELRAVAEGFGHKGICRMARQAADTIEELSAKLASANMERLTAYYNDGWIPCEREMPPQPKENPIFENKPLELYLVSEKNADYPFRAFWNGKYFTDGWSKVDVVAWKPLPESYEPKGE